MDTNVTAVPEPTRVTRTELDATAARLKNWGKWGPDDQVGTLNYTTADDIIEAAKLVRKGQVISLASELRQGRASRRQDQVPAGRPVQPGAHHAAQRVGRLFRHARQTRHSLGRRHGAVPVAGGHALGRARPHLLR